MAVADFVNDPRLLPNHGWHGEQQDENLRAIEQDRDEFLAFIELLSKEPHHANALTIGLGIGGAQHLIFDHLYDQSVVIEADPARVGSWRRRQLPGTVICGDSKDPEVVGWTRELGPYDVLFIDGDHEYAGVKADHENYAPLVRPGGIVAFHDDWFPGPHRVICELRDSHEIKLIFPYAMGIAWYRAQ